MRAIPSSENILLYVSGPVSAFWSWGKFPHQKIFYCRFLVLFPLYVDEGHSLIRKYFIVQFRSWGPFPHHKIFYCTFPVIGAIYTWGPFIRTSWDSIPIKTRHIVSLRSWWPFIRTWSRFWVSAGWITQRWNHIHLFCTLCAASPLFLGLASYLLDHCRIIVMMSSSVLCSLAIGCSSIQSECSWSERGDEKLTKLTVVGPQSCSEAIIWEALQNLLRVQYWFPWDRRAGRRNHLSIISTLSIAT